MPIEEISIQESIEAKISWAQRSHQEIGKAFFRDEKAVQLLEKLREAIQASHVTMGGVGVVDECKTCEKREEGSCCGAGLEQRYDGLLLLINLLLDITLPNKRYDPSSCFFLGRSGCLLLARHVICVNYLCKRITDVVTPKKIAALREKEGIELELLFFLSEHLKKMLRSGVKGHPSE
jgi:hypothetical protein